MVVRGAEDDDQHPGALLDRSVYLLESSVRVQLDSATPIAYIIHQGGSRSQTNDEADQSLS